MQYRDKYLYYFKDHYKRMHNVDITTNDFVIHHIDHNRKNNKLCNLVAIPKELHRKYHSLWRWVNKGNFIIPKSMFYIRPDDVCDIGYAYEYLDVLYECNQWVKKKRQILWFHDIEKEGAL